MHMVIVHLIVFWLIYFFGIFLGWVIPERLNKPFGMLDYYPFHCRVCCSCWSLVALYTMYLILYFNWAVLGCAVFVTSGTVIGMLKTQNERIVEYGEEENSNN